MSDEKIPIEYIKRVESFMEKWFGSDIININSKDLRDFRELAQMFAKLYKIPEREVRLIINLSADPGAINIDTYKIIYLKGTEWVELFKDDNLLDIMDSLAELIRAETEHK